MDIKYIYHLKQRIIADKETLITDAVEEGVEIYEPHDSGSS